MSVHHVAPAGARRAKHAHPGTDGEIREIYPGAGAAEPFRTRKQKTLFGSQSGMATAE